MNRGVLGFEGLAPVWWLRRHRGRRSMNRGAFGFEDVCRATSAGEGRP